MLDTARLATSRHLRNRALGAMMGATLLAYVPAQTASALEDTSTFTASATTQAAIAVDCTAQLNFGSIAVKPSNVQAIITLSAADGSISSNATSTVDVVAGHQRAECTVTGENGTDAQAALALADATWSSPNLSNVVLTGPDAQTLTATLTLSKVSAIGNEKLYVGGALTIPANHTGFGVYTSSPITLTVTD